MSIVSRADLKKMVLTALHWSLYRSAANKILPAMYIEEETELAFDDITPGDPDFSAIQGMCVFFIIVFIPFGKRCLRN